MQHLLGRKGAARIALIPPEVLEALNAGRIATVNLNEFLALDLRLLAGSVARDIGLDPDAIAHALATHASDVAHSWAAQWIAFSSLPVLEPLRADGRRYVQNSVANWLAAGDGVHREAGAAQPFVGRG